MPRSAQRTEPAAHPPNQCPHVNPPASGVGRPGQHRRPNSACLDLTRTRRFLAVGRVKSLPILAGPHFSKTHPYPRLWARYLEADPWLTRAVVGAVAAHLLNVIPGAVDPLHWLRRPSADEHEGGRNHATHQERNRAGLVAGCDAPAGVDDCQRR